MPHLETSQPLDFSFVRDLRKREGLTLEDVSKRCGISIGVLSKLERNQNLVELETLYRLARVFNLSASDLLSLAEECSAHYKKQETYKSGLFDFHRVSFQGVDCFRAKAKCGEALNRPEAHGDEFEICWVQSGVLTVKFTREEHTLKAGEVLKFNAALEHTYQVIEDADVFIVHLTKAHRF